MAQLQRTEEQLIERARSGDRRAQQSLWRAHRRWVAAIILAHRPRTIEVDDLMQDTALKYIDKLDTLRDPAAFRPWLRRIAINICRGAARSQRPMVRLADGDRPDESDPRHATPAAPGDTPDGIATSSDSARRLMEQALTLPPDYREPLLLRCVQSLSYQQISAILEVPVTTVETRLARARRMLREEVSEAAGGSGGAPEARDRRAGGTGGANRQGTTQGTTQRNHALEEGT